MKTYTEREAINFARECCDEQKRIAKEHYGGSGWSLPYPEELRLLIDRLERGYIGDGDKGEVKDINPPDKIVYDPDNSLKISKRELQIVSLIFMGIPLKDIASMLYISYHTVDTHKKNVMHKLNSHNTISMMRDLLKRKLINFDILTRDDSILIDQIVNGSFFNDSIQTNSTRDSREG